MKGNASQAPGTTASTSSVASSSSLKSTKKRKRDVPSDATPDHITGSSSRPHVTATDDDEDDPPPNKVRLAASSAKTPVGKGKGKEAFTPKEAKAGSLRKNTHRRETRHLQALENPEAAVAQRQESGRARSEMISTWLKENVVHLARRTQALQRAAASFAHATDPEVVQAVGRAFTTHMMQTPIPPEVVDEFSTRTLALLADIARDPTGWNPQPHLKNGTIVVSDPDGPAPVSAVANYIRRIHVGEMAIEALCQYAITHPADIPHSIINLLLLGETPASIVASLRPAMIEYGLEQAVDVLSNELGGILPLLRTSKPTAETALPYAGITHAVSCGKRGWDDLNGNADVRIVNFLQSGDEPLSFTTYHIVDLDSPIDSPLDIRTSPGISQKERIVRAVLGAAAMNSADGGVLPFFLPSAELLLLRDNARASAPADPAPLGEDRDLQLEMQLRELIDDEVRSVEPLHPVRIVPKALEAVKDKVASVLRLCQGNVVYLEVTKDIPLEGILAKCGGYWSETVGRGPQEDRHLRRCFHPEIPATGDLALPTIARYIGPYLDFWRVTLLHMLYWLHVLWLSRLLAHIKPLVIRTQSNPVAAMVRSGDLITCWDLLSDDESQLFIGGTTPIGLHDRLRHKPYPQYRGGIFNDSLGRITVVQTGSDRAQLSLHITSADAGRIKYDPVLARCRWEVDFLVGIVTKTVIQLTTSALRERRQLERNHEAEMRRFLGNVKGEAEKILQGAGVSQALAIAKNAARRAELTATFLRAMASSKRAHERWLEEGGNAQSRRGGIIAAVGEEARERQLEEILCQARLLDSFGLPPDPDHLGSFRYPILSTSFPAFIRGLEDGTDIVFASNALGRTEAGAKAAEANQQAIGE
ncbi:hypothetical protein B0H19DRAFT_1254374 [Mycena capillaripes]|nr:hypothetical protein B0H19DRAFT_1254374 [Mycena capillaripes]